ncbi:LysR family transcriptional regulator [Billgrantia endophytica]|uniref:LysR family transcriptional regulator n=1 Tax=Billgrantia endophytica TaxID=2033802 RepID=A0A2N7TX93_9GAMM|nr:LysR family transcriptional regulator [Halomonas endophytica]PMR72817.1 LysR family transcriptional regulator [Halomonas endophytica]
MTLQQLRHFLAIIETGTLSQAAQRCHISQPSMSASLKALEQDLGCSLFTRHAKGLLPTQSGSMLQQHAERVLRETKLARERLQAPQDEPEGTLTLGVTETISAYMLPRLVRWRLDALAGIQLHVIEDTIGSLEERLLRGEVDLGLMVIDNIRPSMALHCERLFDTPRKLWAPAGHPLLRRTRITLQDVCDYPFVLLEMDEHVRTWERYWSGQIRRPEIVLRSHSIEAVRSFVAMGQGVTILSDLVFRPWSLEGEHISRREVHEEIPGMGIGFMHRKDVVTPLMTRFMHRLRATVQEGGLFGR